MKRIKGKPRYVTIFPECCSVHLKKDVGMLPYSLAVYQNYETSIFCYDNGNILNEEKEKFHITYVEKKRGEVKDFGLYLLRHARQIDILNLYHITSRRNLPWILMYKLGNPKGKVHIKLDADYRMLELVNMYPARLKQKIRVWILKKFVNLYTVETTQMKILLEEAWGLDIKLMPNGIFLDEENHSEELPQPEDVFLTVGRLGTQQKATEVLLNAFKNIAPKTSWKLWLVGPVEAEFERYIKQFFEENPWLESRVRLFGNITDPNQLEDIYGRAKVFVLPSRWESFGLVLLEAMERGNHLIVSDQVPSANDVGNNGKFCTVVPVGNVEALANAMLAAAAMPSDLRIRKERSQWIQDYFTWKEIVKTLDFYLN